MERSANGPAAIFFCFKRLIRLRRRSRHVPSRRRFFFLLLSYATRLVEKNSRVPILRSARLPTFDGTFAALKQTRIIRRTVKERLKNRSFVCLLLNVRLRTGSRIGINGGDESVNPTA